MLNEVTSLFDYFNKCKQDKHYKRAAIMAYRHNYKVTISFPVAKKWIDKWITDTVRNEKKGTGWQVTCSSMTEFLNRFIRKMNEASKRQKAYLAAHRPHTVGGATTAVTIAVEEPPEH